MYLKSCFVQDHYNDERAKTVFHSTSPDLQHQDHDGYFMLFFNYVKSAKSDSILLLL